MAMASNYVAFEVGKGELDAREVPDRAEALVASIETARKKVNDLPAILNQKKWI